MIMSNALHQAYGLLDGTVKVGVVAELGRLYLRHRNAGKGPFVTREGQRHLRTQGINELGMDAIPPAITKTSGSSTACRLMSCPSKARA